MHLTPTGGDTTPTERPTTTTQWCTRPTEQPDDRPATPEIAARHQFTSGIPPVDAHWMRSGTDEEPEAYQGTENTTMRPRSPQPITATAARRAAAQRDADMLVNDDSAHAILPNDPERLRALCTNAELARAQAIPHGTATADAWGFGWAMRFGIAFNTTWMRPREVLPHEERREAHFVALMIVWLSAQMKPCKRSREKGITDAKPDSAMAAIYAWRRVLRDCGRYLAPLHLALGQLKALRHSFMDEWGASSLVPDHGKPVARENIIKAVEMLTNHAIPGWSVQLCDTWCVITLYLLAVGARKNEWVRAFMGDTFIRRANIRLVGHDGVPRPITAEEIAAGIADGRYLQGEGGPSKCDRSFMYWGNTKQYFRVDSKNPLNFASAWLRYEAAYPCPQEQRVRWAAFSPDAGAEPYTPSTADARHNELWVAVVGTEPAKVITLHCWRVTLACALLALEVGDGTIQTMLRWKTPEAMRIYAHMRPSQYASNVEAATRVDAAGVDVTDLPEHEPIGTLNRIDAAIADITSELRNRSAPNTSRAQKTKQRRLNAADETDGTAADATTAAETTEPTEATHCELCDGTVVKLRTRRDAWTGVQVDIANNIWPGYEEDTGYSRCTVVGYVSATQRYIIEESGDYYPITQAKLKYFIKETERARRRRPD